MNEKYEKLVKNLRQLEKVLVAFSGGVDSTFLLQAAKDALGKENVIAVTVISPYIPKWEVEEARQLAKAMDLRHEFITVGIIDEIKNNPEDRCYLCKKAIFGKILEYAQKENIKYVIDGTNKDDLKDYRPGLKALKELQVVSPLKESDMTKEDIRTMSKKLNLSTWDKAAYACLLTRIPYGSQIKVKDLERIEKAEVFLMNLGFKALRVRSHGELARIEIGSQELEQILDIDLMDKISKGLKEAGFSYVTLDMQGYKMGGYKVKSKE